MAAVWALPSGCVREDSRSCAERSLDLAVDVGDGALRAAVVAGEGAHGVVGDVVDAAGPIVLEADAPAHHRGDDDRHEHAGQAAADIAASPR